MKKLAILSTYVKKILAFVQAKSKRKNKKIRLEK